KLTNDAPSEDLNRLLHRTIAKVGEDLDGMRFNTAIAAMIELNNALTKATAVPREVVSSLVLLLAPFAPHLAEELWAALGHSETLAYEAWPQADPKLLTDDEMTIPVQLNGKVRATLKVPVSASKDDILAMAKREVSSELEGKQMVKEIYVPGRILNLVIKG
ncbi:MAG: class I tRNA ligase family protein, partial [Myxococcales bacterium]|nr:class I tRNA ligase family protein [Myxococcales bacterium]